MATRSSASLDDHFAEFIEDQVAGGRYASPTDVIHAGFRLLEERETKLAALREALVEGENSGEPMPFDLDDFIASKRSGEAPGA